MMASLGLLMTSGYAVQDARENPEDQAHGEPLLVGLQVLGKPQIGCPEGGQQLENTDFLLGHLNWKSEVGVRKSEVGAHAS